MAKNLSLKPPLIFAWVFSSTMFIIHNIMLLLFVKIYERNLKKLQFTTQRFDTPV